MRRSSAPIDSIMHKGGWRNPSTFIKHYSLPIKHFNATITSVPSDSAISSVQSQPADNPQQEKTHSVQWEDDPDPVDDVLVSHSMQHVNKLIQKEVNFKRPTLPLSAN